MPACSRLSLDMREMILNHASVFAPNSDRSSISQWLKDVTRGMGQLVRDNAARNNLRMNQGLQETWCLPDYSLWDAFQGLRGSGSRDEYLFLVRLVTRVPLLAETEEDVKDRFLACEEQILPQGDGDPLVFCAIVDGIAVGFPTKPIWDCNRITVRFNELLPDGSIEETSDEIDQLTRATHADPICERHRVRLRAGSNPVSLWENREEIFPNLAFGPGVEANLKDFANLFPTILGKLVALDQSAGEWQIKGGPVPPWKTKVTPESDPVMEDPKLRDARKFQSYLGRREMFEWHARFGSSGRIHLRFDPVSREVEIGYIGPHLPL